MLEVALRGLMDHKAPAHDAPGRGAGRGVDGRHAGAHRHDRSGVRRPVRRRQPRHRRRRPVRPDDRQRLRRHPGPDRRVAAAPGVRTPTAWPTPPVQGYAQIIDKDGEPIGDPAMGAPTFGANWVAVDELNPFDLADGGPPTGDDEIVIDRAAADDAGYVVGTPCRVQTRDGPGGVPSWWASSASEPPTARAAPPSP